MNRFLVFLLAVIAIGSIIINFFLYERYSTSRPLVVVGNDTIRVKDYEDQLDYQTQGSVLKTMVYTQLIMQAATKANVVPTDKDIDARIADLQRLGKASPNPKTDPLKYQDFRDSLKTSMALDNLRVQNVNVTDAEVAAFYAQHKTLFVLPPQVQATVAVTRNTIDAATAENLLKQNTPLDVIASQHGIQVSGVNGFQLNLAILPPAEYQRVGKIVFGLKTGQIKTVPIVLQGETFYLTFRSRTNERGGMTPFDQVKDKVILEDKLSKAPPAAVVLAQLYQANKPKFEMDKYAQYFQDLATFNPGQLTPAKKEAGKP